MAASALRPVTDVRVLLRREGSNSTLDCLLAGVMQGRIHLRGERWLEPGSHVSITISHITLAGEIAYCTNMDTGYRICIDMGSGQEGIRRDPRLLLLQDGRVITLGDQGTEFGEGTVLDLAVSGLRLELARPADVGAMILFETAASLIVGEVRHCHQGQNGRFTAGIAITDVLTDVRFKHSSTRGTAKGIRRRLAAAVLGGQLSHRLP